MCGIAGWAGTSDREDKIDPVRRMVACMNHRGPDSHGTVEVSGRRRSAVIGAVRLRILDLSSGADQPMRSADGRLTLAFNGELYNFRELRRQLEARGRAFATAGDTECLLHLYDDLGG